MPIEPVNGMEPLRVECPEDVAALVGLLPRAREDDLLRRGLGDHFSYLAAVHPQWFAPYREVVVTELLDGFSGNFGDFCALLGGARAPTGRSAAATRIWACGYRRTGRRSTASPRTGWRCSAALSTTRRPPRSNWDWTLRAGIDRQGRYRDVTVDFDDPPDEGEVEYRRHDEERGGGYGAVDLRPYDADLAYCNGHIRLTPDVVGTAGGPPLGIYANPHCRSCGRLQFHVVSVEHHVRDCGDGWRSLFLCAECRLVTCNGTGWN